MSALFEGIFAKNTDMIYSIFRVFIGLLFLQHGLQKIFGLFGGVDGAGLTPPFLSQFWWAGIIELIVGIGLALGIFTRGLALLGALEMAVAYFIAHISVNFWPILNQGELALVYFFSFLLIIARGAVNFSLEKSIFGKELF